MEAEKVSENKININLKQQTLAQVKRLPDTSMSKYSNTTAFHNIYNKQTTII